MGIERFVILLLEVSLTGVSSRAKMAKLISYATAA